MDKTITPEYKKMLLEVRQSKGEAKWGTTGARNGGWAFLDYICSHDISPRHLVCRVLDYGAGEGSLKAFLKWEAPGIEVIEYDPCVPEKSSKPNGKFDFVVTTDVLEHVEPDCIDAVLKECFDYAETGVFHHVSTCLTGQTLPDGRDFHILCRPHLWWQATMADAGCDEFTLMGSQELERLQRGKYTTASRFYWERYRFI